MLKKGSNLDGKINYLDWTTKGQYKKKYNFVLDLFNIVTIFSDLVERPINWALCINGFNQCL